MNLVTCTRSDLMYSFILCLKPTADVQVVRPQHRRQCASQWVHCQGWWNCVKPQGVQCQPQSSEYILGTFFNPFATQGFKSLFINAAQHLEYHCRTFGFDFKMPTWTLLFPDCFIKLYNSLDTVCQDWPLASMDWQILAWQLNINKTHMHLM